MPSFGFVLLSNQRHTVLNVYIPTRCSAQLVCNLIFSDRYASPQIDPQNQVSETFSAGKAQKSVDCV